MEDQKKVYIEEAYELLADLEDALLALEQSPDDPEIVGRVFRDMHTIKGSGAMFGFDAIAQFTHHIETVYDLIRQGAVRVDEELISLTLDAGDQIRTMLDASGDNPGTDALRSDGLIRAFQRYLGETKRPVRQEPRAGELREMPESTWRIRFRPGRNLFENGTNPIPLLRELRGLGKARIICNLKDLPDLSEIDPEACYARWDIVLTTSCGEQEIRDVFIFVEDVSEISLKVIDEGAGDDAAARLGEILIDRGDIEPGEVDEALKRQKRIGELMVETGRIHTPDVASALAEQEQVREQRRSRNQSQESASVRVASDKLDTLVDVVGELVVVQARLSQALESRGDAELTAIAEEVERLTSELRDNAMDIRMLPIGTTFARFKRLVRDLSAELGKKIEFTTEGSETELDKTVIEKLGDPLVHLIRNSIDHGIEVPGKRLEQGKNEQGKIHLSARHTGAYVTISVSDDGRGLDTEQIRTLAVSRGLISPDAVLPEEELHKLIFTPGFSTARVVTNVSGRGVGMDVVMKNIESLGGSITVDSVKGRGTTVTFRLPLTLAIIDGLLVKIGGDHFVIPLGCVVECEELTHEDIRKNHGRHIVHVRDEIIPYIPLRELYSIGSTPTPDIQQIVITEAGEKRVGLLVDRVIGGHQTVIKNLGKLLKDVQGISGATILGDGNVALILDIGKIVRLAQDEEEHRITSAA